MFTVLTFSLLHYSTELHYTKYKSGFSANLSKSPKQDTEVVEDLLTDNLSKSTMDPGSDPGGGCGEGSGAPPATNTRAAAGATGFTTGWAIGIGALAMLACTSRATAYIAGRAL